MNFTTVAEKDKGWPVVAKAILIKDSSYSKIMDDYKHLKERDKLREDFKFRLLNTPVKNSRASRRTFKRSLLRKSSSKPNGRYSRNKTRSEALFKRLNSSGRKNSKKKYIENDSLEVISDRRNEFTVCLLFIIYLEN